eukprot:CAMPEP_0172193202 /NCGR_PEP_ID=MMETSP1050-20130122/24813_1 /TAXON_ID=233186 /ORGANISM="Cryptomonas curvata, Strain CCAP979/52" /LENGTH=163 /DNA_ID=CAMNT_0012868711 /DNA_START=33 /DNA_END=520 /DNA_ORIENTATION=+
MSYKREVGDRSFPVPRTWAEGSWVRSENKHRCCTPFWVNIAAISLCAVGVFSILQSGLDMKNIGPWIWSHNQQNGNHHPTDTTASPRANIQGLGKQVGQLESRMSIIGEQEEEAQKRLIAAEDALRREASSHGTSSELSELQKEVSQLRGLRSSARDGPPRSA